MHSSLLDRILGIALVLFISAWAVSWAVRTVIGVLPVLVGLVAVVLGGTLAWRWYRDHYGTGW